eukprot:Gb_37199 [translate_table: standard]
MKREGRQHGHVKTHTSARWNEGRPKKNYNHIDSPPTAGCFQKVQSKPTNHSKFTGECRIPRCRFCHMDPFNKSRTKTKGQHKYRSSDVLTNYRMYAWRPVSDQSPRDVGRSAFISSGQSAASLIARFVGSEDIHCDELFDLEEDWSLGLDDELTQLDDAVPESHSVDGCGSSHSDSWEDEIMLSDWCFIGEDDI